MMPHISVKLRKLHHMETLTRLLRPILHLATNLRSLSLPIHTATAKLLNSHAFGYLRRNLKVKVAYKSILSLNKIILARSQFQSNHLCTYYRPDELQLQRMVISPYGLDHRSTIKLLRRMQSLEMVKFHQVEDPSDFSREVSFLSASAIKDDWLYIGKLECVGSDLHYACLTGLHTVAIKLLEAGSNVNAQGGECRCPLNAAVCRGHKQLAKRLIDFSGPYPPRGNCIHFSGPLALENCTRRSFASIRTPPLSTFFPCWPNLFLQCFE